MQTLLSEYFDGKTLNKSVHPDEAVAYGAAVQGAILSGVRDSATANLLLVDVIPLSLGIEVEGKSFAKVVPQHAGAVQEEAGVHHGVRLPGRDRRAHLRGRALEHGREPPAGGVPDHRHRAR